MKKFLSIIAIVISISLMASCGAKNNIGETNTPEPTVNSVQSVAPSETPLVSSEPSPTATPITTTKPTNEPSPTPEPTQVPTPEPTPVPTIAPTQTPAPGSTEPKDIPVVKGIYLSEGNVTDRTKLNKWIQFANDTEVNAFVINVKNDSGYIVYDSQNETAKAAGAIAPAFNVKQLVDELHANGIYAIARVVCFKDEIMGSTKPEWTLTKTDGTPYKETTYSSSTTWMSIANEDAGKYIVEIAREVLDKGFDEVQFDYVRFPGNGHGIDYSNLTEAREYYVHKFVTYAAAELSDHVLSVDIFGITCIESYDAGGIGQSISVFNDNIDVISPMIYPSHYANSSTRTMGNGVGSIINGNLYEKPDLDPYGVVYDTLVVAADKISKIEGYKATMRPYLQGFTATYLPTDYWTEYGAEKFQDQIQAVYDAGYKSWIFWDSSPSYPASYFGPPE
ncbi:MAG: hypothetical protein J7L77_03490 [Clostridiales bacterium]|nr:hypothetical protein [Clostridiales bacterium]